MSITNVGYWHVDGRLKGSYVYMLVCKDEEGPTYVKVGLTDRPTARLRELRHGLPMEPRIFALVELPSRSIAKRVELELIDAYSPWKTRGEWISISDEDRKAFNQAWQKVFRHFAMPGWPLRWSQVAVEPIVKLGQLKRRMFLRNYMRKGRAYRDFRKDLQTSQL